MKKLTYCLILAALFLAAGIFNGPVANAESVKLKAVCFLPKMHPMAAQSVEWVKRVNETLKGELEVDYIGGPEIAASKEQIQALKNGVFDINFNVTSYYAPHAPELNAFQLSKFMPWEERKAGGFYDYMLGQHERIGVFYAGRWLYGSFYVWTKEPVAKPADLAGRKLRVGPMYVYFMKKLDVSTVSIKPTDVYTALERGTVDGFAWPLLGARDLGWTDSTKYLIDEPFYGMDGAILFNLDVWNKLSKSLQKKLMDLTIAYERDMVQFFQQKGTKEREMLKGAGVKFVKFSKADSQEFIKKADDAYWEFLQQKVPDLIPDLKKVTGN
jgi:TRAP-type C4-dicarboxylate transport system substrate-binding protein